LGLQAKDPTIAELLKPLGYATGQFGKNHLGDRNEYLPTVHGFDEFFGNLYHLNAEEDPESFTYRETQNSGTAGPARRAAHLGNRQGRSTEQPRFGRIGRQRIRTRARSRKSAWRPSTTRPPARRWISWSGR